MTRKFLFGVSAVVSLMSLLAIPGSAQTDPVEIAVQGRSEDGGNQFTIVGNARRVRFSLTGRRSDLAGVVLPGQRYPVFEASIQDIINGRTPLRLEGITTISDGRTRIFVRIDSPSLQFNGSRVQLRTGNYRYDSDPVLLR